jgi:hypothetical protein
MDEPGGLLAYEWRAAARLSENPRTLCAIDTALTATGLAAEIRVCVARLQKLTR